MPLTPYIPSVRPVITIASPSVPWYNIRERRDFMIKITKDYYVQDGRLYVVKELKPTKWGYRVVNKDGKRQYVSIEKIKEIEEKLKCKKSQSTK
jgi:hypothetical protein